MKHQQQSPSALAHPAAHIDTNRRRIKLGIDAHAEDYRVVRAVEGCVAQPAQRFRSVEALLAFVANQLADGSEVCTCYEAGPLGYSLHRELTKLGAKNVVIAPVELDERRKGVKTDARDALALCSRLGRYVAGDTEVFSVVAVPTPQEEHARMLGRERDALLEDRMAAASQLAGRHLYLTGKRLPQNWWSTAKRRAATLAMLPAALKDCGARTIARLDLMETQLAGIEERIEAEAPENLPHYMGRMSASLIDREMRDWARFKNRRAVGSYTGLCPRVDSSGGRHLQGSVNKHGNPRIRTLLVELAWRLFRHQHEYYAVKKWLPQFASASTSRRKKLVVALARRFAVDWWRVKTGRCTAESLGLRLAVA